MFNEFSTTLKVFGLAYGYLFIYSISHICLLPIFNIHRLLLRLLGYLILFAT